jgi:hypothetical protein
MDAYGEGVRLWKVNIPVGSFRGPASGRLTDQLPEMCLPFLPAVFACRFCDPTTDVRRFSAS